MPDTKISALPAVTTPVGGDEFAVNQGGTSKKETGTQIAAAIFLFDDVKWQNATDSLTGFQILDNDGGVPIFNVDTINERVGFLIATPARTIDVGIGGFLTDSGLAYGLGSGYAFGDKDMEIYEIADDNLHIWGGDVSIIDPNNLASESLTDPTDLTDDADWDYTGEVTDSATDAVFTFSSTGAGTITQTNGAMAIVGANSRWYRAVYVISGSTVADAVMTITNAFALAAVVLSTEDGTHTVYFESAVAADSADFVIDITGATSGAFTLESITVKLIQGGDVNVYGGVLVDAGRSYGAGSGYRFGDGDTEFYENSDDSLVILVGSVPNTYEFIGGVFKTRWIYTKAGTVSLPAFTFSTDIDSGMYTIGADNFAFSVGGNKFFELGGSQTASVENTTSSTGDTNFLVKAGAGQAADLQSWKDASDGLLASIGPTGAASAQPGGSIPVTKTYTKDAADLTTSSNTEDEVLFTLPARSKILSVSIKHTIAFSGGSLSAMTVSVGDSAGLPDPPTFYASAFDIFSAASATNFQDTALYKSSTYDARDVLARFTSTGDTMDNVTAGDVEITIQWVTLP